MSEDDTIIMQPDGSFRINLPASLQASAYSIGDDGCVIIDGKQMSVASLIFLSPHND